MKHIVFSIYDCKAGAYLPPFSLPAEGMAKRTFTDCINDPTHAFGKHPHDYTLFRLGTFCDASGKLEGYKESMGNGVEFLHQHEQTGLFEQLEERAAS